MIRYLKQLKWNEQWDTKCLQKNHNTYEIDNRDITSGDLWQLLALLCYNTDLKGIIK